MFMTDNPQTKSIPSNEDIARAALDEASEKLGSDIVLLDTRGVSSFTDFFVIVSSDNRRQMAALSEELIIALKKLGFSKVRVYLGSWGEWGNKLDLTVEK